MDKPINESAVTWWGMTVRMLGLLLVSGLVGYLAQGKLNLGLVPAVAIGLSIFGVSLFALLQLKGAPKEVGFTFGLKFLSVTAYKILNITLVLWLANDMGLSKESAALRRVRPAPKSASNSPWPAPKSPFQRNSLGPLA